MPPKNRTPDIVRGAELGTWYVRSIETNVTHTWAVGDRYELLRVLGEGSFSCVCLALDRQTNTQVALKRVGDVLASTDNAKRVLRECTILRRLRHPNIVAMTDLWMKPSSTGRFVFRGGQLVPTSYDLYMALEYCDQGDLFHMKGQLSEHEVRVIMWQLLDVLRYMHGCDVWHRDIKSANILITVRDGVRVAKLCDFGSARSAVVRCDARGPAGHGQLTRPSSGTQTMGGDGPCEGLAAPPPQPPPAAQALALAAFPGQLRDIGPMVDDAKGRVGGGAVPAANGGPGFAQPLTRMVCTPCYRAPEVIISHGQYSSALDMWSLGCVFGELLQRMPYLGKSAVPHLQVAPVIAVVGGEVPTPKTGESFALNPSTCKELASMFAVVGTPAWGTVDAVVTHPAWNAFLRRVPGRPSQIPSRFAGAGPEAVDLLSRLLEFDPQRRASAEEAAAHAYFDALRHQLEEWQWEDAASADAAAMQMAQTGPAPAASHPMSTRSSSRSMIEPHEDTAGGTDPGVGPDSGSPPVVAHVTGMELGESGGSGAICHQAFPRPESIAKVLAAMESELEDAVGGGGPGGGAGTGAGLPPGLPRPPGDTVQTQMRRLLERECDEAQQEGRSGLQGLLAARAAGSSSTLSDGALGSPVGGGDGSSHLAAAVTRAARMKWPSPGRRWGIRPSSKVEGLKPDPGVDEDPSEIALARMPHHRDAEQAGLLPEQHLREGRHQEWVPTSLASAERAGPRRWGTWGVSLAPPASELDAQPLDPGLLAAIRQQQYR